MNAGHCSISTASSGGDSSLPSWRAAPSCRRSSWNGMTTLKSKNSRKFSGTLGWTSCPEQPAARRRGRRPPRDPLAPISLAEDHPTPPRARRRASRSSRPCAPGRRPRRPRRAPSTAAPPAAPSPGAAKPISQMCGRHMSTRRANIVPSPASANRNHQGARGTASSTARRRTSPTRKICPRRTPAAPPVSSESPANGIRTIWKSGSLIRVVLGEHRERRPAERLDAEIRAHLPRQPQVVILVVRPRLRRRTGAERRTGAPRPLEAGAARQRRDASRERCCGRARHSRRSLRAAGVSGAGIGSVRLAIEPADSSITDHVYPSAGCLVPSSEDAAPRARTAPRHGSAGPARRRPRARPAHRRPRHRPGRRHAADGVRLLPLLGGAPNLSLRPARREPGDPCPDDRPRLPDRCDSRPAGADRRDPSLPSASRGTGGPRSRRRRPSHPCPYRALPGARPSRLREPEHERDPPLGLAAHGRLPALQRPLEPTRPAGECRPARFRSPVRSSPWRKESP